MTRAEFAEHYTRHLMAVRDWPELDHRESLYRMELARVGEASAEDCLPEWWGHEVVYFEKLAIERDFHRTL